MSTPTSNDFRVRAFYLALAGDQQATTVTAEQLRTRADGLAGHPVDGKLDPVEVESLLTVARNSSLPTTAIAQLRNALENGTGLTIPAGTNPQGPNRFPRYLDLSTLTTTQSTCGCDADVGTLSDNAGNQMEVARGSNGLVVRFAAAGQSLDNAKPMALNPAEEALLAPQLAALELRQARQTPEGWADTDWDKIMANYHPAPGRPIDEHVLSGAGSSGGGGDSYGASENIASFQLPNGTMAFIRYQNGHDEVSIAYSPNRETTPGAFRPMSAHEVETFMLSRKLLAVQQDLSIRNFTAAQSFLSATDP